MAAAAAHRATSLSTASPPTAALSLGTIPPPPMADVVAHRVASLPTASPPTAALPTAAGASPFISVAAAPSPRSRPDRVEQVLPYGPPRRRRRSSSPSTSRAPSSSSCRKRKSPCATISLFRSPLSRMMLSPRIYPPGAWLGSASVRQGTSLSTTICRGQRGIGVIDLNVALEEETSPSTIVCRDQIEMGGIDLNVELEENDEEAGNSQGDDEEAGNGQGDDEKAGNGQRDEEAGNGQGDARRKNMVPDEQRRVIFDLLLARAINGYLKPHETTEVAAEFSVHVRTVQRIWKKGKTCLDQGLPVDVSSAKKRMCGRKKTEIDVSTLSNLIILERTTLDDVANHFQSQHLGPWILQRHSINSIQNIGPNNTRTHNRCGEG